ncbi:MAG: DUF262 domain-containing protein [Ignavibacteriae bacterium]|nr:DUF262 domain-containing protein [Ignavibacteriota bacterium]
MNKHLEVWTISELIIKARSIVYPDFQREPTIWDRRSKQRLVDSIARQYDISSLYFYKNDDIEIECIDGRQRINAIMSFVGRNTADTDNKFPFAIMNEMFKEEANRYAILNGMTYSEIENDDAELSKRFVDAFNNYSINVVMLSDSTRGEEFNLQFARLNLGVIINSGEKLHAMVGDMRDACFDEDGLTNHGLINAVNIPTRRYAKEQVVAQILCQLLWYQETGNYTRTRYKDLAEAFLNNIKFGAQQRDVVNKLKFILKELDRILNTTSIVKNRAITISIVLFAYSMYYQNTVNTNEIGQFLDYFIAELEKYIRNISKDTDRDSLFEEYHKNITQASVEKSAVTRRDEIMKEKYLEWAQHREK